MKKQLMFLFSVLAYLVSFSAILLWILSISNLIPTISIDGPTKMATLPALLKNLGLVALFGITHSIMARQWFKDILTRFIPEPMERSNFVLVSGLLLAFLVLEWEPLGGVIWQIAPATFGYYLAYVLFFAGWAILFISSFLINHFDLFGLRQGYLALTNQPYTQLKFRIVSFYKYVRHPLYFGGILGLWATTNMTVTHLVFAIGLTAYFVIGALFEERDMVKNFGQEYLDYQSETPMILPVPKRTKA